MYHDVGTVLQRTNQIGCAEGVIHDEGDAVLVGYSSHTFEVEHIGVGVAEGLGIYYFCVGLDSCLERLEVVYIKNGIADTLRAERVGNQVVGTAIEVVGSDDMVTSLHDVLKGISDSSSTRGDSQTSHTTLEGCDAIFEHTLSGVGQTTIDISCIAETETIGCMLRVTEHIRCGLINRYGTCVGSGVSLFLSYMKL